MGFATVFATIAFAFIFASMIVFAAVVQHNLADNARVEQERDERANENSQQEITISQASYTLNGTSSWSETLYADFADGTNDNTTVTGAGSITLTGIDNGTYTSNILDTGVATPTYGTISWTSVEPVNADILFQLRAGASAAAAQAESFTGPDGTTDTYYSASGTQTNTTLSGKRYIQYQARLNTTGASPELQSIAIEVNRDTGVTYLNVTNTGKAKLEPGKTDVYIDGQRVARNETKRVLLLQDRGGQALWDPDEILQIHVYRTLSGSTQVTVANGAATDSTVVN